MLPALDEAWFDRYRAIKCSIGDAYEILEPDASTLDRKRQTFEVSGRKINIALLSDRVVIEDCERYQDDLQRLKEDITKNEANKLVRGVYFDAINDQLATTELMIAGATGDKKRYEAANLALYDRPDPAFFKAACSWIRNDAKREINNANAGLSKLAEQVLNIIPSFDDNHEMLIPSEKIFQEVRKAHQTKGGYYELLFRDYIPESAYITQDEGDEICRRALKNIGSSWTIAEAENNVWAVMRSRKELVRPSGYRLDRDEFIGIVSHEIGSHILEEVNGEKQQLRLLGTGLAGFEKGNEGRAFLREQIVYSSERTFLHQFSWEYIILLHLSVDLATGLHKKPYTFVELYETLYVLYAFWRERRMPYSTNNDLFAHDEAWYLTVRTMKGTDGTGGCYMKDSVYLEGNVRCWQLAEKDPQSILFGDQGMFDITNKRHREIVQLLTSDPAMK